MKYLSDQNAINGLVELIHRERHNFFGDFSAKHGIGELHHAAVSKSLSLFLGDLQDQMRSHSEVIQEIDKIILELQDSTIN